MEYFKVENLDFVGKSEYPPNVPQRKGIEKFWACCKPELSKLKKPTTTVVGFKRVWKKISKVLRRVQRGAWAGVGKQFKSSDTKASKAQWNNFCKTTL